MTVEQIEHAIGCGEEAWGDGAPMPPFPNNEVTFTSMFWVGFLKARSRDFFKRRAIALYPDCVEPRP